VPLVVPSRRSVDRRYRVPARCLKDTALAGATLMLLGLFAAEKRLTSSSSAR
jgi:hypothetical protein